MDLIAGTNKDFKPSACLKYDLAARHRAAADHYLRWDLADPHLWSLCFTGPARMLTLRTVTCFRCRSSELIATQCNFRRFTDAAANPLQPTILAAKKITFTKAGNSREPCHRFNKGVYDKSAESCKYKHCCSNNNCGRPHPSSDVVQKQLQSECDHGHTAGSYDIPPLENFQCSGLGVVSKKGGAWHVIMHLLAPFGSSVNDYVSKEDFGLKYSTVDNAIVILQRLGLSAAMAKVDIKHAFSPARGLEFTWP